MKLLKRYEKSAFLKIAAQAFEAGDFLNIFLRFWGFSGTFLIKNFLIKKPCSNSQNLFEVTTDSNLAFEEHINSLRRKSSQELHALSRISQYLSPIIK